MTLSYFSGVNGVNGRVEKKNWEVNDFIDVNSVNGENREKKFGDALIFWCQRCQQQHQRSNKQCFWSFYLSHLCFFRCQRRQRQSREKNGMWMIFLMSTASTVKIEKKNWVMYLFFNVKFLFDSFIFFQMPTVSMAE